MPKNRIKDMSVMSGTYRHDSPVRTPPRSEHSDRDSDDQVAFQIYRTQESRLIPTMQVGSHNDLANGNTFCSYIINQIKSNVTCPVEVNKASIFSSSIEWFPVSYKKKPHRSLNRLTTHNYTNT